MTDQTPMEIYDEADLYCAAFDEPIEGEVRWVIGECERLLGRRPRSVLEPMCGNARYGAAFADRGVRYHGLDASTEMLHRAPVREGVSTSCSDVREFHIPGDPFDFAWCPINSIRHLPTREDVIRHLRCVATHLPGDGLYLVETDLHGHDGPYGDDAITHWSMPQSDGSTVLAWWGAERTDLAARRIWEFGRFERHRDGTCVNRSESRYEMLLTRADDWLDLAAASGFRIEQVTRRCKGETRRVVELSSDLEDINERILLFLRSTGA
jgi:SAM-dependent methyltransferase